MRTESPIAVLIAGGSGTGKSTIAVGVAARLGIGRVVSTDVLRVAMRAATTPELMPHIFRESFEGPLDDVANFELQSRVVAAAVSNVLTYCAQQGWSIVVEGVHLVPGFVVPVDGIVIHHVLLAVPDEHDHAERFGARERRTGGGRPAAVYHANLPRIRSIQRHLVELADEHGVVVIANDDLDEVVERIAASVR